MSRRRKEFKNIKVIWFCYCSLGKSRSEMCWFYMDIAQMALDPPPSVKQANVEKKVLQTILESLYTPLPLSGNGNNTNKLFFKQLYPQD